MDELTEVATSRFVAAGPIRVHYNEAGNGETLIFCEGQGAGTSAWVVYHRVLTHLAARFRCVLLDQPGYGKSDPLVVTTESRSTMYARTVRDVMDALGIERATIVDMSFGAQTAQVFALDYPERVNRLVLHAAGIGGPALFPSSPDTSLAFVRMNEAFEQPSIASLRGMMNAFLYRGEQYSDEELMLAERLAGWLARPELEAARKASKSVRRDIVADLGKIAVPVLMMHGRNDLIMPLEGALRLVGALPDARLIVFPNCGHWIPFERPKEFARYVVDFVEHH
jgi:2-hydroxy-6-oxonona-2,4-dienedioate hydrolase